MSIDYKTELMRTITVELGNICEPETARNVIGMLMLKMADYEVKPEERQIAMVNLLAEQYLKMFLATKRIEGRSEKTLERYSYILRRMFKAVPISLDRITVFHLRAYMAQLEIDGMSVNSIAGIRNVMRSFFGWVHREGLLTSDPTAQLGLVKKEKIIERPFDSTEMDRIREACRCSRDRAIVEFLRSTGCRIDEVIRLNVADLNMTAKECKVFGKGAKERIVYFDDVCRLHLERYFSERNNDSPALFAGLGRRSMRLTDDGVRIMLKRIEKRSGVENIHPHRFRRTLATNMIRYGMAVQDVGHILGHANINTTMRYVYMDDTNVKSAYNRMIR